MKKFILSVLAAATVMPGQAQLFTPESYGEYKNFIEQLKASGITPTEIAFIEDPDVELYLKDETKILFSKDIPLSRVLDNLLSVLNSDAFEENSTLNLEYIDLRFGNKVYYKERGGAY